MGNGSDYDIGKKISKKLLKDKDHLINAIELDRSLGYQKSSKDLINKAIIDTTSYLFNNSKTIFKSKRKYILWGAFMGCGLNGREFPALEFPDKFLNHLEKL